MSQALAPRLLGVLAGALIACAETATLATHRAWSASPLQEYTIAGD